MARPENVVLDVSGLAKIYSTGGQETSAVRDLTFDVGKGEFVSIVGPSGCGKTTMLKCISALLAPSAGTVHLDGQLITAPSPKLALVFQDYSRSLLPWLTVRRNVLLPLEAKGVRKDARAALAEEALESVGLAGFFDHYPWQLSGGMQQRVAIARALAYRPEVLLMDEPFASVDAQTRADLEDLLLQVREQFHVTIVFVTHDIDEAVYLSDRVVALTKAPSVVREAIEIDLPRPRDQVATRARGDFAELRSYVYNLVRRSDSEAIVAGGAR